MTSLHRDTLPIWRTIQGSSVYIQCQCFYPQNHSCAVVCQSVSLPICSTWSFSSGPWHQPCFFHLKSDGSLVGFNRPHSPTPKSPSLVSLILPSVLVLVCSAPASYPPLSLATRQVNFSSPKDSEPRPNQHPSTMTPRPTNSCYTFPPASAWRLQPVSSTSVPIIAFLSPCSCFVSQLTHFPEQASLPT